MDTPEGWCQPQAKDVSSYLCDFFATNNKHRLLSWYRSHCLVSTGDVDLPNIATKLACCANFKDQDKKRVFMLVIYRDFALRSRRHVSEENRSSLNTSFFCSLPVDHILQGRKGLWDLQMFPDSLDLVGCSD